MVSGVMTNLVLAFLLFGVVFMGHGINVATTTVDSVSRCVIAVTKSTRAGAAHLPRRATPPRRP